MNDIMPFKCDL